MGCARRSVFLLFSPSRKSFQQVNISPVKISSLSSSSLSLQVQVIVLIALEMVILQYTAIDTACSFVR